MRYAAERAMLKRRGIANADTLSASYVARLSGLPAPSSEPERKPEPKGKQVGKYSDRELRLINRLNRTQLSVYMAIRRAAEAGDWAPTWLELQQEPLVSGWAALKRSFRRLEELGALTCIPGHGTQKSIYTLPIAGLETRRE